MNWLFLTIGLTLVCLSIGEQYTDRYDNINVQEVLDNKRLFNAYMKCILDKGSCTPEGRELKSHIKDAIQSSCSKCTDKQKQGARLVVNHIRDKEPKYWEELKIKYDPDDQYKEIYEAFLIAKD
uniref:Chemosensory protein n=1 Tax=Eogystia hippophaecolus TaxID=1206364 RepID=A0A1B3P5K0_EOGHI|nr:chemosensory protein [Eogystia hippophaecolus]